MTDQAHINLPGVLADIAEVAGLAAALQVAAAKGGVDAAYIPLPENLSEGHWLVEATGIEAARKIAERLGGGEMPIPLGPAASRERIWLAIRTALAQGTSGPGIARLLAIHERTVRRHRNGHSGKRRPDIRQGRLL